MEQSPSSEVNTSYATEEIICILWNQRFIIDPVHLPHPTALNMTRNVVKWKWREELMWFMWSSSVLKRSEAKKATVKS